MTHNQNNRSGCVRVLVVVVLSAAGLIFQACNPLKYDGSPSRMDDSLPTLTDWPDTAELILFETTAGGVFAFNPADESTARFNFADTPIGEVQSQPHRLAMERFLTPTGQYSLGRGLQDFNPRRMIFAPQSNRLAYSGPNLLSPSSRTLYLEEGYQIIFALNGVNGFDFSPDGSQLAYGFHEADYRLPDDVVLPDDLNPDDPDYSARAAEFVRSEGERVWQYQLRRYDFTTQETIPLLDVPRGFGAVAWSPQGDRLAYTLFTPGQTGSELGLYLTTPSGESPVLMLAESNLVNLAWSPSGQWLAAWTGSSDGQVFVLNVETGDSVQVEAEGVVDVSWSPQEEQLVMLAQSDFRRRVSRLLPVLERVWQYDLFLMSDPADPAVERLTEFRLENPVQLEWLAVNDDPAYAAALTEPRPASASNPAPPVSLTDDSPALGQAAPAIDLIDFNDTSGLVSLGETLDTSLWQVQVLNVLSGEAAETARIEHAGQFAPYRDPLPPGTQLVGVEVAATNTSNLTETIYSGNFYLRTDGQTIYRTYSYQNVGDPFLAGELAPGGRVQGWIAYLIPETERPLILQFDDPARSRYFQLGAVGQALALREEVPPLRLPDLEDTAQRRMRALLDSPRTSPSDPAGLDEPVLVGNWRITLLEIYPDPLTTFTEIGLPQAEDLAPGQRYVGVRLGVEFLPDMAELGESFANPFEFRRALALETWLDAETQLEMPLRQRGRDANRSFLPGASGELVIILLAPDEASPDSPPLLRITDRPFERLPQYFLLGE